MHLNDLEIAVLDCLVKDPELGLAGRNVSLEKGGVIERSMTGAGFITDLERREGYRLFGNDVSLRWGKVGARLNAAKLEVGFLVYVDEGYLTAVEGYTYGEPWPDSITSFELYELDLG